jgi:Rod binding domain-containing protein
MNISPIQPSGIISDPERGAASRSTPAVANDSNYFESLITKQSGSGTQTHAPGEKKIDASHIAMESLAGNQTLSKDQKIAEASRQFEAILLRQFLSESQKTVIKNEFSDNSAAAGIYQDMITNQLADCLSQGKGFGLAETFRQQLTPRHHAVPTT